MEISSPQADIDKPVPNLCCQRKVKAVGNVSGNKRNNEDTYGKRFGASVARYGKSRYGVKYIMMIYLNLM